MKLTKAFKMAAAFTAIAAGIGTAVYLVKNKLNTEDLPEDFDDDLDDDFDDFDDDEAPAPEKTREYVNVNIHHPASEPNSEAEAAEPADETAAPAQADSDEAPAAEASDEPSACKDIPIADGDDEA